MFDIKQFLTENKITLYDKITEEYMYPIVSLLGSANRSQIDREIRKRFKVKHAGSDAYVSMGRGRKGIEYKVTPEQLKKMRKEIPKLYKGAKIDMS